MPAFDKGHGLCQPRAMPQSPGMAHCQWPENGTAAPRPAAISAATPGPAREAGSLPIALSDGRVLWARLRFPARCRRPRLSLSPAGALTLSVPRGWTEAQAHAAARAFAPWLARAWARLERARPRPGLPDAVDLPLAGLHLAVLPAGDMAAGRRASPGAASVVRAAAGSRRVLLAQSGAELRLFGALDDTALCARALRLWGRATADRLLPGHLRTLALAAGFPAVTVSVRDQRTRWGSCSRRDGAAFIRLNWRAVLLPVPLLNHLCHHELCHLRHMDHSPAYRAELARLSPGWQALERALSRAWRELPWWTLHAEQA